jgi:hypothetical protein
MGARQYVPGLGRFLEVDPVEAGSANDYEYCFGDAVNCLDLDGQVAFVFAVPVVVISWKAIAVTAAVVTTAVARATVVEARKAKPKDAKNKTTSSTKSKSRAEVEARARREAERTRNACYRGPCRKGDHVHTDHFNGKGDYAT